MCGSEACPSRASVKTSFKQFKACTCGKRRLPVFSDKPTGASAIACKSRMTLSKNSPPGNALRIPVTIAGIPADLLVRVEALSCIIFKAL